VREKWGSKLDPYIYIYIYIYISSLSDLVHATVDLVRGRVSKTNVVCRRVSAAGLPPLSRGTVIQGCLLSNFDWTSWYRRASSELGMLGLRHACGHQEVAIENNKSFKLIHPDHCLLDGAAEAFMKLQPAYTEWTAATVRAGITQLHLLPHR